MPPERKPRAWQGLGDPLKSNDFCFGTHRVDRDRLGWLLEVQRSNPERGPTLGPIAEEAARRPPALRDTLGQKAAGRARDLLVQAQFPPERGARRDRDRTGGRRINHSRRDVYRVAKAFTGEQRPGHQSNIRRG